VCELCEMFGADKIKVTSESQIQVVQAAAYNLLEMIERLDSEGRISSTLYNSMAEHTEHIIANLKQESKEQVNEQ
jgi:hypothetical protein